MQAPGERIFPALRLDCRRTNSTSRCDVACVQTSPISFLCCTRTTKEIGDVCTQASCDLAIRRKRIQETGSMHKSSRSVIYFFLYYQVYKTRGEIESFKPNNTRLRVACENIRFSSLFTAGDAKSEEKRMFSHARLRVFLTASKSRILIN